MYQRVTTSASGCGSANSNAITVTVYGQLNGGAIGSDQSICYNTTPAAFTNPTSPSGGTGLSYQWQNSINGGTTWNNIAGATGLTYTVPAALTATTMYQRVTTSASGCGSSNSNAITVTVYGQLNGGAIGSDQSICYNTTPAAFTNPTSPSGGTGLSYQWQNSINGGTTWNNIAGATGLTYTVPAALTATTMYVKRVTTSASGCG